MATDGFVERRKSCRIDKEYSAYIKVGKDKPISCTVRNISSMGAFLEFQVPASVPPRFNIVIPEYWFEAQCEVRHATIHGVGVHFMTNRREAVSRFASPYGTSDQKDSGRHIQRP